MPIKNIMLDFYYEEKSKDLYKNRKNCRLFEDLSRNSLNMFFRGGDIISTKPQVIGKYEPILTEFINYAAMNGYADFLIDIGANIGLTSCQSGKYFKEVHMFEPNPYSFKILEVNTFLSINSPKYFLYKFGLGDRNKKVKLTVPKKNWGGAFVKDSLNAYNEEILAKKDGFIEIEKKNYYDVEISIKKTSSELKKIFKNLGSKKIKMGVIKIDVEGYETIVLKGIADSINDKLKVIVIFENHNPNFNVKKCEALFKGKAKAFKFETQHPSWEKFSKGMRFFSRLFGKKITHQLGEANLTNCKGDIALIIN